MVLATMAVTEIVTEDVTMVSSVAIAVASSLFLFSSASAVMALATMAAASFKHLCTKRADYSSFCFCFKQS